MADGRASTGATLGESESGSIDWKINCHSPASLNARLVRVPEPFDHPDWLFELKYDGFRAMAYIQDGKAELVSRKGNAYHSFEPLRAQLATLGHDLILDGEITLVDGDGRPRFYDLLRRRGEPVFYAFDCLWLDGRDLRNLPLIVRKGILEGIVPKDAPLLYASHFEGTGEDLFQLVCDKDLEGIVCKHSMSTYASDELPWIVLNPKYSQREGHEGSCLRRGGPLRVKGDKGRTRERVCRATSLIDGIERAAQLARSGPGI